MATKFICTALKGTNKAGTLKPDADGYYTVVLGGFAVANASGEVWPEKPARAIIEGSGTLQQRIAKGRLRGEYGHPKKHPSMSVAAFINRNYEVYEENTCVHIAEVWLGDKPTKLQNGRKIVPTYGKIKPAGPHGPVLKEQLENSKEDVTFSIRSFVDEVMVGLTKHKHLKNVITWDYVNDPGIDEASKFNAPALESASFALHGEEHLFTVNDLNEAESLLNASGIATESSGIDFSDIRSSVDDAPGRDSATLDW